MNYHQTLLISLLTVIAITSCDIQSLSIGDPDEISSLNNTGELHIILKNVQDGEHKITDQWNSCDKYKCFNSLDCELNDLKHISYYVYPPLKIVDTNGKLIYSSKEMMTREYRQLLDALLSSPRITLDPSRACLFVPSIDLNYLKTINPSTLASIYDSLPLWNFVDALPGTNHMIINLDPTPDITKITNSIGRALHVSTSHNSWTKRPEFDQSIPVYLFDPTQSHKGHETTNSQRARRWQIVFVQYNSVDISQKKSMDDFQNQLGDALLVLGHQCQESNLIEQDGVGECELPGNNENLNPIDRVECRCSIQASNHRGHYKYPEILSKAQYCLIFDTTSNSQVPLGDSANYILMESIKRGCIPIISADFALPFDELIPWSSMSIALTNTEHLGTLMALISNISTESRYKMSQLATQVWSRHFSSPGVILQDLLRHYDSLIYPEVLLKQSSMNAEEIQDFEL